MPELTRPTWVEIDLDAIVHNVRLTRGLIGPGVKLFACVKADAYGCGLVPVARTVADAGVDALAVADPHDVVVLRDAGLTLPILLFSSTLPEQAAAIAALDVIVSMHDFPSLKAFAALSVRVKAFMKIDCNSVRYGFIETQWHAAFEAVKGAPNVHVLGIYAHAINPEDSDAVHRQARTLDKAFELAVASGLQNLDRLFASSRFILGYPDLLYTAVDPGRLLLGQLPGAWASRAETRPAVRSIKSRITQIQEYPADPMVRGTSVLRAAVAPVGFADGFPAAKPNDVLVCGRRARVISNPRGIESTVIDVTDIPAAQVGTEVVLLGNQGTAQITGMELASNFNCSLFELMYRLTKNTHKKYIKCNPVEDQAANHRPDC